MRVVAYIDGGAKGNPGEAGYGVVLKNEKTDILVAAGRYIGHSTNNVAEYRGLMGCLEIVAKFEVSALTVYSDSELLVKQMKGIYRVRKPHLQELHAQILNTINRSPYHFEIHHIPREKNSEADGLAGRAIRLRSDIDE